MEPPHLLLRTLISLGLFCLVANQTCDESGYTLISNPRRSTEAVHDDEVYVPLCDHGLPEETWFRFSSYSGDKIVERVENNSVPILHCGTEAPIYIRGHDTHPKADNTNTSATVCANYGGGNSCKWSATIQIYRCPVQGDPNHYFLYKLKSPPGCSLAYCVGDKAVCDFGDHWNGFSCVDYLPVMDLPIFSEPRTNDNGTSKEIFFTCEVQYVPQPNDSNARFRVTFLFDGLPLEDVNVGNKPPKHLDSQLLYPNSSMVVVLDERHLRGRLGKEISCQVESYWDGFSETVSRMRSATSYYATFESTVESYDVSLSTGSTHNVTFKSTLPFTCHHCENSSALMLKSCCRYRFYMAKYNLSAADCDMIWQGGDTVSLTVYIVPEATQVVNSFALVFDPYSGDELSEGGPSLWRDYVIPTVKMTILPQPIPYKYCHSITDPHLLTFDGVYFNSYVPGDMYLVKAIDDDHHMEIQVSQEECNDRQVTCNCGVVVREGNSAFKISICELGTWSSTVQRSPTVVRLLSQDPEDAAAVYMDPTGLKFSIRMPSGLRVEVDATVQWFNVYVYLPPEYHGKTDSASMCGNSDDDEAHEFADDYSEKFRIPNGSSYFRHQPNCSTIFNVAATHCGCNKTYPVCSNKDPTLENVSAANHPFLGNWTSGVICMQPIQFPVMSSSLYDDNNVESDFVLDNDVLFPPYTYDPNFGANVSFTWPTPSQKTKEEVEVYCTQKLQSSQVYADCSANADVETGIAMCMSDIQIVDDWLPINAYVSFFEQNCLNNVAASITSTSDSANDVLKSISGKLCPNNCTQNGQCLEGTCSCMSGYIGADCSIDQSLPPSLTGIIRGGVCDVRARPCDVISVYGKGVAMSSALMCRFTDQTTGAHIETKGTFITAVEYSCPVPETTTHRRRRSVTEKTSALSEKNVSITTNGSLYSNAIAFVLFDSVCMECNTSDTCRQRIKIYLQNPRGYVRPSGMQSDLNSRGGYWKRIHDTSALLTIGISLDPSHSQENSCLITDECFADMAFNPSDTCLQCIPSVSSISWINVTVVEDWSPCTRDCDTGVASKKTTCGTTVANEEVEFCKELDCPDNAEEKPEGVGITLSSGDLELIMMDPVGSLVPFSDALNQYCSKNAATCCSSIGMETHASAVAYTSPDLVTYASGYPVINTDDASLKVIAKIDRAKLAAECSQTPVQGSTIVYGASNLLYDAVTSEKSDIEKTLSITITSVWSSTTLPSASPRTRTSVSTIYSLLCLWVFVLVWNNIA